jgi:ABC-type transport system involved in cytochrome c biogenesis permease component
MKSYIKFLLGFYAEVFSARMLKVYCGAVLIIFLLTFPAAITLATANLWPLLLYIITIPSMVFAVAKFDEMGL